MHVEYVRNVCFPLKPPYGVANAIHCDVIGIADAHLGS